MASYWYNKPTEDIPEDANLWCKTARVDTATIENLEIMNEGLSSTLLGQGGVYVSSTGDAGTWDPTAVKDPLNLLSGSDIVIGITGSYQIQATISTINPDSVTGNPDYNVFINGVDAGAIDGASADWAVLNGYVVHLNLDAGDLLSFDNNSGGGPGIRVVLTGDIYGFGT